MSTLLAEMSNHSDLLFLFLQKLLHETWALVTTPHDVLHSESKPGAYKYFRKEALLCVYTGLTGATLRVPLCSAGTPQYFAGRKNSIEALFTHASRDAKLRCFSSLQDCACSYAKLSHVYIFMLLHEHFPAVSVPGSCPRAFLQQYELLQYPRSSAQYRLDKSTCSLKWMPMHVACKTIVAHVKQNGVFMRTLVNMYMAHVCT